MKMTFDHDLHIHSYISPCGGDPTQTAEKILRYATENNLKCICVTDHFWDEKVPSPFAMDFNTFERIGSIRPLPQTEDTRFLFGCETDLDVNGKIGVSPERMDEFDFIIVATTHFHHNGIAMPIEDQANAVTRANAWVKRFDQLLNYDLPHHKVGLAHPTSICLDTTSHEHTVEVIKNIPETEMYRLFKRAAELGVGIELNRDGIDYVEEEAEITLKPYFIAKECGCKFYCGSDAHNDRGLRISPAILERGLARLDLDRSDCFDFTKL